MMLEVKKSKIYVAQFEVLTGLSSWEQHKIAFVTKKQARSYKASLRDCVKAKLIKHAKVYPVSVNLSTVEEASKAAVKVKLIKVDLNVWFLIVAAFLYYFVNKFSGSLDVGAVGMLLISVLGLLGLFIIIGLAPNKPIDGEVTQ